MKNKTILAILTVFAVFFSLTTKAQDSKIMAGAGLNYASDISTIGISAKGVYLVNETWEAAPSFTYYLKKNNVNWSTLDFDAHYVFSIVDDMTFYAIGGINVTFWKIDYDGYDYYDEDFGELADLIGGFGSGYDGSGSDFGVNIGAGGRYALTDQMYLNADMKYTIGGSNFLSASVGILYHF